MMTGDTVYLVPVKRGDDGGLDVVVAMEPERLTRSKELFYVALKRYSHVSQIHASNSHASRMIPNHSPSALFTIQLNPYIFLS
jgi:hypothetical protein